MYTHVHEYWNATMQQSCLLVCCVPVVVRGCGDLVADGTLTDIMSHRLPSLMSQTRNRMDMRAHIV